MVCVGNMRADTLHKGENGADDDDDDDDNNNNFDTHTSLHCRFTVKYVLSNINVLHSPLYEIIDLDNIHN
jgi:hypothetical protein